MLDSHLKRCEFFILRYAPNPIREEFVNIGIFLRELAEPGLLRFQHTDDWSRVKAMDPTADVEMLEQLVAELATEMAASSKTLIGLQGSLSNAVQLTDAKVCLAADANTKITDLMNLYVQDRVSSRPGQERLELLTKMRVAFDNEGLWASMKKHIAADRYTKLGDPLKIDCAYRRDEMIRMFHAVSLRSEVEAAALSSAARGLIKGVKQVEGADLDLVALVEGANMELELRDRFAFGRSTMEEQNIRVVPIDHLHTLAAVAKLEMLA